MKKKTICFTSDLCRLSGKSPGKKKSPQEETCPSWGDCTAQISSQKPVHGEGTQFFIPPLSMYEDVVY